MNLIDVVFQRLRESGRKAFLPFLTAGDPDVEGTVRLGRALAGAGANLIEIGFPYSDPIADGPVIQASYTRALSRGLKLDDIFSCARRLADAPELRETPLVAMTSYSLIHRRGAEAFVEKARQSGFAGAIVPDLPFDESETLGAVAAARDFKFIQLVTPMTPRDRAAAIAKRSTGFLYCVSVAGITGERDRLPDELTEQLAWLRTQTSLPLCVGFGVGKPEIARMLRPVVDGIIVGSAIVRRVEQAAMKPFEDVVDEVTELARSLVAALSA